MNRDTGIFYRVWVGRGEVKIKNLRRGNYVRPDLELGTAILDAVGAK